jgi:hypothetical protein
MLARNAAPFKPWLQWKHGSHLTNTSDYYQETVLHALMMGADNVLFFNPYCPKCGSGIGKSTSLAVLGLSLSSLWWGQSVSTPTFYLADIHGCCRSATS